MLKFKFRSSTGAVTLGILNVTATRNSDTFLS